jgi:D-alanyl-D-alanine carboxypeptidase
VNEPATLDLSALAEVATGAVVGVSASGRRSAAATGDVDEHSVFRIASLTKTFTAVATVRAARAADVPLTTPVQQILPDLTDRWSANGDVTIEHLLAQTAGFNPAVTGADAATVGEGDDALLAACGLVVERGSDRRPGACWEYYNGNYFLAGAVTAELMSCSYEDALEQLVLTPAGLRRTSFVAPTTLVAGHADHELVPEAGYPRARRPSGGLTSSVDDLLRFAEHVLADRDLLDMIATLRTDSGDPMRYGFGWAVGPSGQLYLNGRLAGYRAAMLLVPESAIAAVALANDAGALPAIARVLSDIQIDLTGDDLAAAIDEFAA